MDALTLYKYGERDLKATVPRFKLREEPKVKTVLRTVFKERAYETRHGSSVQYAISLVPMTDAPVTRTI